jgi:histidinol-phosphatase (PHP family)
MPYSHHSHSGQFCKHGEGSLESIALEAQRKGFKMYALTEHCPRWRVGDLYDEEVEAGMKPEDLQEQFDAFLVEAHRLRDLHRMEILVGVESEHIYDEDLDLLKGLVERNQDRIEFVVGSVHHVNGYPIDFTRRKFNECLWSYAVGGNAGPMPPDEDGVEKGLREYGISQEDYYTGLEKLLEEYFHAQRRMLEALKPAVIGHFLLPFLFAQPHSLDTSSPTNLTIHQFPKAETLAYSNIEYIVSYGGLIELSSAALRKGFSFPWPGEEVVEMVVKAGGKFCLSDDAHKVGQVAAKYRDLKDWAKEHGIRSDQVARLTKRKNGKLEVVVDENADIWEDDFWNGL